MNHPFTLIPWDTDFLAVLHARIHTLTEGRPERAVVVFPHDRPRRYLIEQFRGECRALMLPRMLTVRELFTALRPPGRPLREAGLIDRISLLHACCREVARADEPLIARLAAGEEATFFAWGERLADLLEECLVQRLAPTDLGHAETEVAPFGADLLAALGRIFQLYVRRLPERGRTTPGLNAYLTAEHLDAHAPDLPGFLQGKVVLLAGFHTLTGTEERVFRHLWARGAHVVLHSDPALVEGGASAHWACAGHARWIAKWNAAVEAACPPRGHTPRIHYFSGYDLHSQLAQLAEDLEVDPARTGAVALTHPELLLPVLHHLPCKDCNISLGYPFERTLLYRLIDLLLRLVERQSEDGLAPWRELAELACHPWLRLLRPEKASETSPENAPEELPDVSGAPSSAGVQGDADFVGLLHVFDATARQGNRLQDPRATAEAALQRWRDARPDLPPERAAALGALLDACITVCVEAWDKAETLADMAACLSGLVELLGVQGRDLWRRFPLDAECLTRLLQKVIPPLRDNDLADSPLPVGLRHSLLRAQLRAERVPFEADPIIGLQVLGMLETRLLRFDRVFIVDATDDALPGPPGHDPLLPDSLRAVIGLPDTDHREQLAAHTFHRLLAGADDVYIYWQEGVQPSGLLDGAKQRSRLVEALIWQEEQRTGRLLAPGEDPLRAAAPRLRPPRRQRLRLARTPVMHERMAALLAEGLTAARLDAYLTCPLAFYYRYAAGLRPVDEVNEGDDPAGVGDLLHDVLREAYTPYLGREVRAGDITPESLQALFAARLAAGGLSTALPPESAAMLALAGPERLRRYLDNQPECTRILGLEQELAAPCFAGDASSPLLRGRLDRVDARPGAVILDYKTGRIKRVDPDLWTDDLLWSTLRDWLRDAPPLAVDADARAATGDSLLLELALRAPSLQLPVYMQLYRRAREDGACATHNASDAPVAYDAAWVELGENGAEHPLLGPAMDAAARAIALDVQIPLLLAFVMRHMRDAAHFCAHEGAHCDWCLFRNLCMITE